MPALFQTVLVVALSILPCPASMQASGDSLTVTGSDGPISVQLGGRSLQGEELRLYLDAQRIIEQAFTGAGDVPTIARVKELVQGINDLPSAVGEDARWFLRSGIWDRLNDTVVVGDRLAIDLFASGDETLQSMGVNFLLNEDTKAWFADRELRRTLRAMAGSREANEDVRAGILTLFEYAERFEEVQRLALKLAQNADRPSLARQASRVICWRYERKADAITLSRLFHSQSATLRQEAALDLATSVEVRPQGDLRGEVSSELMHMIQDVGLDPRTRGEAIEAVRAFVADEGVITTLLSMLEPEKWFFGVIGPHHAQHSLTALIKVLAMANDARVTERLKSLRLELDRLGDDDRHDIEITLRALVDEASGEVQGP